MSAARVRAVAADFFHALASIPRRRLFWLLLTAAIGYAFGYQDAFRGAESLGWKFGALVDRLTPAAVSEARLHNSEAIRERAQRGANLAP
jgi:hypothetical protein